MPTCRVCCCEKPLAQFEKVGNTHRKLCRPCRYEQHRLWALKNKEDLKAKIMVWISENRESYDAYHAAYREANREKIREQNRKKRLDVGDKYNASRRAKMRLDPAAEAAANKANHLKHREKRLEAMRKYATENPDVVANIKASRRVRHSAAAIPWHKELTDLVVLEAAKLRGLRKTATGITWQVDHIVPLKGRVVSGFHVYNNLAVIPESVNRAKFNKHEQKKGGLMLELLRAIGVYAGISLASVYALWILYVCVMGLKRAKEADLLHKRARIFGTPVLIVGYALDVLVNVIVMTVLLLELPRETTVTARLKRHLKSSTGWRLKVARGFVPLLDPFDVSGKHITE